MELGQVRVEIEPALLEVIALVDELQAHQRWRVGRIGQGKRFAVEVGAGAEQFLNAGQLFFYLATFVRKILRIRRHHYPMNIQIESAAEFNPGTVLGA